MSFINKRITVQRKIYLRLKQEHTRTKEIFDEKKIEVYLKKKKKSKKNVFFYFPFFFVAKTKK